MSCRACRLLHLVGGEGKYELIAKFLRAHFQLGNQKGVLSINYIFCWNALIGKKGREKSWKMAKSSKHLSNSYWPMPLHLSSGCGNLPGPFCQSEESLVQYSPKGTEF